MRADDPKPTQLGILDDTGEPVLHQESIVELAFTTQNTARRDPIRRQGIEPSFQRKRRHQHFDPRAHLMIVECLPFGMS
jgi:hypothetical protein